MNYRHGCTADAAGKKARRSFVALALAVGLALAYPGAAALAAVDMFIKIGNEKKDGIPITTTIDPSGKFSVQLKEPGNYTVSTACKSGDCTPSQLQLNLPSKELKNADGTTSYEITVGKSGASLSGQIQSAAGVRVAPGDVDGDGVETRKAAPKKAAGKTPHKIVEILGNQSPEEIKVGDPLPPYGQPVIFTASKAAPRPAGGDGKAGVSGQAAAGGLTSDGTVPPPINGIGGTYTTGDFTAPQMRAYHPTAAPGNNGDGKTAAAEPCCPFIKPPVTPRNVGDAKLPGIINNSETAPSTVEAINVSRDVTPSKGSDAEKPGLATPGTPIQGIPIGLEGEPGSIKFSTTTDEHGAYHFDNLPAGNYKMTIAGLPKQSIRAGASGPINGEVMRANNGAIYLTALKSTKGGHIDVLEWSWGLANKGTVQLPGPARGRVINNSETDTSNVDASNRDHIDQDAQFDVKKRTDVQPDGPGNVRLRVPADVSTLRGTAPGPDERDVKLGTAAMANEPHTDGLMILRKNSGGITISAPTGADTEGIRPILDVDGNSSTDPIVAAPKGGDAKLPGILRVINNSETAKSNVEASNRDHIDQDAQMDIKKGKHINEDGIGTALRIPRIDVKSGSPGGNPGGGNVMATVNQSGVVIAAETMLPSRTDSQGNSHFDNLPGLAGKPVAGIGVSLGKPGGGIMATLNSSGAVIAAETMIPSKTDSQGNFHFDKLPAGNYELTLPGLPAQLLTVGADGIAGGKVIRGPDGSMTIFDRWGNRTATAPKGGGSKTAEKPVGFGSGNTMGTGPGGMGPGGGMTPPGAGPAMGGAGPAMGGPGSAMGGPGSAMKNR